MSKCPSKACICSLLTIWIFVGLCAAIVTIVFYLQPFLKVRISEYCFSHELVPYLLSDLLSHACCVFFLHSCFKLYDKGASIEVPARTKRENGPTVAYVPSKTAQAEVCEFSSRSAANDTHAVGHSLRSTTCGRHERTRCHSFTQVTVFRTLAHGQRRKREQCRSIPI
jgi:hypothetical protein